MINPTALVTSTTTEMIPEAALPSILISSVGLFHTVHRFWRFFRLGQIYANPNNFIYLLGGHGLNTLWGESKIIRISALCLLVAIRILDCIEQQEKLQSAWKKLHAAWAGHYPRAIKVKWRSQPNQTYVSPSTAAYLKYNLRRFTARIQKVAFYFIQVLKEAFILGMRFTDAVEVFYLSPDTRNEAVNLIFVNGSRALNKIMDNKECLIEQMNKNKDVIDKILKGVHSSITGSQIIKKTQEILEKTELVTKKTKTTPDPQSFFSACLKKWKYEIFSLPLLNQFLIPEDIPEISWEDKDLVSKKERFASNEILKAL